MNAVIQLVNEINYYQIFYERIKKQGKEISPSYNIFLKKKMIIILQ